MYWFWCCFVYCFEGYVQRFDQYYYFGFVVVGVVVYGVVIVGGVILWILGFYLQQFVLLSVFYYVDGGILVYEVGEQCDDIDVYQIFYF